MLNQASSHLKSQPVVWISLLAIVSYLTIGGLCFFGGFRGFEVIQPDLVYAPPSLRHWLGTDIFGRDVFARAAHGTLTALTVGFLGSSLALFIGTILGGLAGYFGGRIDEFILWLSTTIDTMPTILLVVAFSFVMGPSLTTLCLAVGFTYWVSPCRTLRSEFMKHRDREYVQAAEALGASHLRRIFHILPNTSHLILIHFALGFVSAIKSEVILSYLGLGVEAGTPSWGVMINDARLELARGVWWNLTAATLFLFFLVLSFNLFTDKLREAFDPKLRDY